MPPRQQRLRRRAAHLSPPCRRLTASRLAFRLQHMNQCGAGDTVRFTEHRRSSSKSIGSILPPDTTCKVTWRCEAPLTTLSFDRQPVYTGSR